jgi:hypothetical protein
MVRKRDAKGRFVSTKKKKLRIVDDLKKPKTGAKRKLFGKSKKGSKWDKIKCDTKTVKGKTYTTCWEKDGSKWGKQLRGNKK